MREICERCGEVLTEWWIEGELIVYCSVCYEHGQGMVAAGILDHDELYDYAGYTGA